mgnify:FL=1
MTDAQRIEPEEIVDVLPRDAIAAILKPQMVSVVEADNEMHPQEMIVTLTVGDDSRAYPISVLSAHEVVNDTVGGRPVVVTW